MYYRKISNIRPTKSQNLNESRLVLSLSVQSIETSCWVANEDVVGAAPTGDAPNTSEWSTTLLRHILEVWQYVWLWYSARVFQFCKWLALRYWGLRLTKFQRMEYIFSLFCKYILVVIVVCIIIQISLLFLLSPLLYLSFVLIVTPQIVFKLNTVFASLFPINTIISLSYGMTLFIRLSAHQRCTQQFKYLFLQLFQFLTNIYWDINSVSLHFFSDGVCYCLGLLSFFHLVRCMIWLINISGKFYRNIF